MRTGQAFATPTVRKRMNYRDPLILEQEGNGLSGRIHRGGRRARLDRKTNAGTMTGDTQT